MSSAQRPPAFSVGIVVDCPPPRPGRPVWPEYTHSHLCTEPPLPGAQACLLPANGIDPGAERARAWWYDGGSASWRSGTIPLPPVLYNRIGRRRVESSRAGRRLLARLGRRRPLFNRCFLDKGSLYQALRAGSYPALPPFHLLQGDASEALAFYRRHRDIYIKPVDGSLGAGLLRLTAHSKGGHRLAQQLANGLLHSQRLSDGALFPFFSRLSRRGRYVLQATVPLARWSGRPFDLRVLMQRSPGGQWALTGVAARVAPPGGIATHTVRGGAALPFEELGTGAGSPLPDQGRVEELARRACETLESEMELRFFELSFDFGVDPRAGLLLLEANAKPYPFDEEAIRRRAGRNLFAFAAALAADPALLRPRRPQRAGSSREEL